MTCLPSGPSGGATTSPIWRTSASTTPRRRRAAESRLSEQDLYLFGEGTHYRLYEKLGAHPGVRGGVAGTWFAVWAPNAREVSAIGDWNGWDAGASPLERRGAGGLWEGFAAGAVPGSLYKY